MSVGKGIQLSTGFDVNTAQPLDSRELVNSIEERDALINVYNGLRCYVNGVGAFIYIDGVWSASDSKVSEDDETIQNIINEVAELDAKIDNANENMSVLNSTVIELNNSFGELSSNVGNFGNEIDELDTKIDNIIEYSDTAPQEETLLWVDTSSDGDASSPLLSNEIILEFQGIIEELRTQIDKLKKNNIALERRIAYLEQHGGGGGNIPDYEGEELIMVFEDGTQMTFEDGSIMIFEEYVGDVTKMTFEDNSIMTFEDGAEMTFEK